MKYYSTPKFETSARIGLSDDALEAPLPDFAAKETPPLRNGLELMTAFIYVLCVAGSPKDRCSCASTSFDSKQRQRFVSLYSAYMPLTLRLDLVEKSDGQTDSRDRAPHVAATAKHRKTTVKQIKAGR